MNRLLKPSYAVTNLFDDYYSWYLSNRKSQALKPYDDIRSRRAYNESPLIRSAGRSFVDNVIGTGLRLQATPDSSVIAPPERELWSREIESPFAIWSRENDWVEIQHQLYRTYKVQGSALLMLATNRMGEIEMLAVDPAVIDKSKTIESESIFNGIEVNRKGKVVAIHLRDSQEYDIPMKRIPRYSFSSRLNFILFTTPKLSGEVQGEGVFCNLSELAYTVEQFLESAVLAAKVNASVLGYLRSELPLDAGSVISKKIAKIISPDGTPQTVSLSESGAFTRLNTNEKIEFLIIIATRLHCRTFCIP